MIRIESLKFHYGEGNFALSIPELEIPRGGNLAVAGPSGSGKTTLLRLVAGILVPQAGRVSVGDTAVSELSDAARRAFRISRVGFVFQNFELLDYLTVEENILLPYFINGAQKLDRDSRNAARELANEIGLGSKLGRRPAHLSHGERQRTAICRALSATPDVLLADEPTGNLDPANKDRILDLLFEQAGKRNATLVVVTHDHQLLPRFDRKVDFADFVERGG